MEIMLNVAFEQLLYAGTDLSICLSANDRSVLCDIMQNMSSVSSKQLSKANQSLRNVSCHTFLCFIVISIVRKMDKMKHNYCVAVCLYSTWAGLNNECKIRSSRIHYYLKKYQIHMKLEDSVVGFWKYSQDPLIRRPNNSNFH